MSFDYSVIIGGVGDRDNIHAIFSWCNNNFGVDNWMWRGPNPIFEQIHLFLCDEMSTIFWFTSEHDATLFALKWS